MSTSQQFQGEFSPPKIGIQANPIKIAGAGSCKVTDEGIRIQGFKDNRLSVTDWSNAALWLLLSFIIGFFFPLFWFAGVGYAIRLIYLATRAKKLGKQIDILIPWKRIASYRSARTNEIILRINKFKSNEGTFDGELFFLVNESQGNPDYLDFVEELVDREVKCTSSLKLDPRELK
jgi:hypothetical protein